MPLIGRKAMGGFSDMNAARGVKPEKEGRVKALSRPLIHMRAKAQTGV